MIKFNIVEDTITDYLTKVYNLVSNESNNTSFLRDAGQELHMRYVQPEMPKWNPNLMISPLEPNHQIVNITAKKSSLELIYTGFTQEAIDGDLPKGVWSEFGDKYTKTLERDYAYYQETTIDPIADPSGARSPHFVKKGTANYATEFHYKTMAYVDRIMHLEGWNRVSKQYTLEDYISSL